MKRASGVLMHVSSLWGDFSEGAFGKAAEENAGTDLGALYADLDKICRAAGDLWCPEAEKRLFAYAGIDA